MHIQPGRLFCGLLAPLLLAAGCTSVEKPEVDPSATLKSPDATRPQQVAAVRQLIDELHNGEGDKSRRREAVKNLAWRRGLRTDLRLESINALIEDDPNDSATMLGLMLPTETSWPIVSAVADLAIERNWVELLPAFVRSWSRPVLVPTDDDRPERRAILALAPGESAEAVVYRIFSNPEDDALFGDRARLEAWALLQRIDKDGSHTRELLASDQLSDPSDAILEDLLAGARELRIVPRTAEELKWLRGMRAPEFSTFWATAAAAATRLSEEQLKGFSIRHIPAVVWASEHEPSWLEAPTEELLSRLRATLGGRKIHQRTDGYIDFTGDQRETLETWESRLAWGDVLLLLIADRTMTSEALAVALFEQAAQDRDDRSTELGGAINSSGDELIATLHPPRPTQRMGDTRFVASGDLLNESTVSLFHYHFHAQKLRNEEFAGPGAGDLEYARRFGRACLVFTSISDDVMNVDFYQPSGARIDLGEIHKPISSSP